MADPVIVVARTNNAERTGLCANKCAIKAFDALLSNLNHELSDAQQALSQHHERAVQKVRNLLQDSCTEECPGHGRRLFGNKLAPAGGIEQCESNPVAIVPSPVPSEESPAHREIARSFGRRGPTPHLCSPRVSKSQALLRSAYGDNWNMHSSEPSRENAGHKALTCWTSDSNSLASFPSSPPADPIAKDTPEVVEPTTPVLKDPLKQRRKISVDSIFSATSVVPASPAESNGGVVRISSWRDGLVGPYGGKEDKRGNGVFCDPEAMKERVRKNVMKPVVSLAELYKAHGPAQFVARSAVFEYITLTVIAVNTLWIAIDTDLNKAAILLDAEPEFQFAEHFFCAFFVLEWLIRFLAFELKRNALQDKWFVFDTALVVMMVLETWVMTSVIAFTTNSGGSSGMGNASVLRIARLMRLSRMARMARLLRALPELLILFKGMLASMRSVLTTLLLLLLFLYVFGIAFAQLCSDTDAAQDLFPNVTTSMYTLLLYGALSLDYVGDVAEVLATVHVLVAALFFVFVLLAALTVMNMLIGVLCEIVSAVAATEKEELLVSYVKTKIEDIVDTMDVDGDHCISRAEFEMLLQNEHACMALKDVGVDVIGLVDFVDVIFEDTAKLNLEQFMDVVLQLRSANSATVKDIIELRKLVRHTAAMQQILIEKGLDVKLSDFAPEDQTQLSIVPTSSVGRISGSKTV